jgi:hypothetical protein
VRSSPALFVFVGTSGLSSTNITRCHAKSKLSGSPSSTALSSRSAASSRPKIGLFSGSHNVIAGFDYTERVLVAELSVLRWIGTAAMRRGLGPCALFLLGGCASAPAADAEVPEQAPPGVCGNAVLHELFEKELAVAQAEPDPEKRAEAVCKVAHDWHIEDCSNVTPRSLNLP